MKPDAPECIIRMHIWEMENLTGKWEVLRRQRRQVENGWVVPPQGWIKLNFDGAVKGGLGVAGCRGVIRDEGGRRLKGFRGVCHVNAELWGVL